MHGSAEYAQAGPRKTPIMSSAIISRAFFKSLDKKDHARLWGPKKPVKTGETPKGTNFGTGVGGGTFRLR